MRYNLAQGSFTQSQMNVLRCNLAGQIFFFFAKGVFFFMILLNVLQTAAIGNRMEDSRRSIETPVPNAHCRLVI